VFGFDLHERTLSSCHWSANIVPACGRVNQASGCDAGPFGGPCAYPPMLNSDGTESGCDNWCHNGCDHFGGFCDDPPCDSSCDNEGTCDADCDENCPRCPAGTSLLVAETPCRTFMNFHCFPDEPPPPSPPPSAPSAMRWGVDLLSKPAPWSEAEWTAKLPYVVQLETLARMAYLDGSALEDAMLSFLCGCPTFGQSQCPSSCTWSDFSDIDWGMYASNWFASSTLAWAAQSVSGGGSTQTRALILHDRSMNVIVIAFRGTNLWSGDGSRWTNLNFATSDYLSTGMRVHEGFRLGAINAFNGNFERGKCPGYRNVCPSTLRSFYHRAHPSTFASDQAPSTLLTGHSLGGAMASIAAYGIQAPMCGDFTDCSPSNIHSNAHVASLVTFGAPRVGCDDTEVWKSFPYKLLEYVPGSIRITTANDPIPNVPGPIAQISAS